jgi:hypothetical protein
VHFRDAAILKHYWRKKTGGLNLFQRKMDMFSAKPNPKLRTYESTPNLLREMVRITNYRADSGQNPPGQVHLGTSPVQGRLLSYSSLNDRCRSL